MTQDIGGGSVGGENITVLYINNHGGGFADRVQVRAGTTAREFFSLKMPGQRTDNFLLRVNRQAVEPNDVLREGDRVNLSPAA